MKRRSFLLFFLIFVFLLNSTGQAAWVCGLIHLHSLFSDGARTPAQITQTCLAYGYDFYVETDHANKIGVAQSANARLLGDYGWENYTQKFSSRDILILAGLELDAAFEGHNTHTLAIGNFHYDQQLLDLQGKEGAQQAIINRILARGMLPVAAHPYAVSTLSTRPANPSVFVYDPNASKNLAGIEFFNEDKSGYNMTLAWYLGKTKKENVFPTGGCDSHYWVDKDDQDRLTRPTYVYIEGLLTYDSLMDGLRRGGTYAARAGVYIKKINFIPGFKPQESRNAKFVVDVHIAGDLADKKMRVYRDGKLIGLGFGEKTPDGRIYRFTDMYAEPDETYKYILEIEDCLITSPIVLRIVRSEPASQEISMLDRNGNDAGRVLWDYMYKVSKNKDLLKEFYAKSSNFPNLNASNFLSKKEQSNLESLDPNLFTRWTTVYSPYSIDGYTRCDVQLEQSKNSSPTSQKTQTTWMFILEDGAWKIMNVTGGHCIWSPYVPHG